MKATEKITKRFEELSDNITSLTATAEEETFFDWWAAWIISAQSLVKTVFGEDSPQYVGLTEHAGYVRSPGSLARMRNIFAEIKRDFDAGFPLNLQTAVSGEILGDFVGLAQQALDEGNKDVAAVLVSGAMEDALKRYSTMNGLDVEGKQMEEVVNALKTRGLVSGVTTKMLDGMPKVRNHALHAEWDKLSPEAVGAAIGFLRTFLMEKFG